MSITGFHVDRRDGISHIMMEVEGPAVISLEGYVSLVEGLIKEGQRQDVGVVVLCGAPGKFFFGMNLSEIEKLQTRSQTRGTTGMVQDLLNTLEAVPAVLVCAVDGSCFGGGLELALAFHYILATPQSEFALPEIKVGTIPSYGGTQRLPRIIGRNRALEMLVTGKPVHAEKAFHWGLVTEIVEREALTARVKHLAEDLAKRSRPAVQALLRSVIGGADRRLEAGLHLESMCSSRLAGGEDLQEGIRAFFEKRPPRFPSTQTFSEEGC